MIVEIISAFLLLLGAFFWDDTDNAVLMETIAAQSWMQDWTMTRMYENPQSNYPMDYNLNMNNEQEILHPKFVYSSLSQNTLVTFPVCFQVCGNH